MPLLHKKSSQSLTVSPKNPFSWKMFKIGSVSVRGITKIVPNLQVGWPTHDLPTVLTKYQGGLFNKQELVWLNFCTRVYYVFTFLYTNVYKSRLKYSNAI